MFFQQNSSFVLKWPGNECNKPVISPVFYPADPLNEQDAEFSPPCFNMTEHHCGRGWKVKFMRLSHDIKPFPDVAFAGRNNFSDTVR